MPTSDEPRQPLTYASAGVSIDEGDRFVGLIGSAMRRTFGPRVIDNPGGFAGLFRLDYNEKLFKRNYREPVLVACADGVGTKIKLAAECGNYRGIGVDLVGMNVNDLVVQGAEPLFFLDYIATGKLEPEIALQVVEGISEACKLCGAALLGGETAEMPGVYDPGVMDLAGFAVGVVELDRATDTERVEPGDIVLGLASDGAHSNGFTLVRAILEKAGVDPRTAHAGLDRQRSVGDVLLTPTRLYAPSIVKLLREYKVKKIISGMAHITGGGLAGNLVRALHDGVDAEIERGSWAPPPVFSFLQELGGVEDEEMDRVFNMGIGYCVIVRPSFADSVAAKLRKSGERVLPIGRIVKGTGVVRLTS